MKIKELKRTVNASWSPAETHPVYLAAGSAAQQVDASFSSTSTLDIYALNLEDPGLDLELKSSLQTEHKFQKLVWSGANVIVGGCDGGLLEFYSADRVLKKSPDALLGTSTKHTGAVSALDVNPYQKNLLASGASESEIFIWDLNNTTQPMAPGNRSQPCDPVQSLAWNQQVQHILGSTFATRCVVWDLRKNEPIMKLSDSQSRTRWRSVAWHPSVATQLCIASEDDQAPVVQLWDLRLAASPLVTLEGHHKGVMSLSWCRQDPDLMLSAGKDGRVLCWNPNNTKPGGELLVEVAQHPQWVFEVSWCPRNPGLLSAACFDQRLALHSLLAGTTPESTSQVQNNIMDSFGGVDSFSSLPAVQRAPQAATVQSPQLPRPPRWLHRQSTAKFAFGGKLVTFENCPQEAGGQKLVYISQVVSEPEIVERATELDSVLGSSLSQEPGATERLAEYCRQKGEACSEQGERYTWFFLRASFLPTFRSEVLNLLGFKQDDAPSKFKGNAAGETAQQDAILSRGESTETEAELSTDTSTDLSDAHTLIERKLANVDLGPSVADVTIPNGEDTISTICRALVSGNLEEAVELCLEAKRIADALIIASLGSQELLYKVQKYHLNLTASDPVSLIAGSLLMSQWDRLIQSAAGACWRDTLAALVTHCDATALRHYCEMLGDKLSKESDPSLSEAATICYLCGMSPSSLVQRWSQASRQDAASLAKRVELALLLRRAAQARGSNVQSLGKLESVLEEYAARLASQGCLHSALNTLEGTENSPLRHRLLAALRLVQLPQRRASNLPTQQVGARARSASTHSQKRGHVLAHNDVSNTYSGVSALDQSWGSSSVAAPPPAPFPAHGAPAQPPRPPSTGPATGGITSRSKYKVDPSVQSAPLYNQYSFNSQQGYGNPGQPGYGNPGQPGGYGNPGQPSGGYNSPLPDQYGAASVPAPGFTPINPAAGSQPQFAPAPTNPAVNGGYYQPAMPQEPPPPAPASRPVPPGWNDPPMPSAGKAKPKQEVHAQAPITHPLFGVEPPQHIPLNPAQQYPGQQQQYPGQQQQYPGQQQQYPGQQLPYPSQQQYQDQQYPGQQQYQGYPQQAESPAPVAEPALPVQKPPLPEQHAVLQSVLDSLRTDCAARAANPQMKRKLEDVHKRLETLYDLLRDYRLSESALSSLHQCVQCVQTGDYEGATSVATSLAGGTDFAAVASFLPGLKVLFQIAQQLQVYVR